MYYPETSKVICMKHRVVKFLTKGANDSRRDEKIQTEILENDDFMFKRHSDEVRLNPGEIEVKPNVDRPENISDQSPEGSEINSQANLDSEYDEIMSGL